MKNYKNILLLILFLSNNIIQCDDINQAESKTEEKQPNKIREHLKKYGVVYLTVGGLAIAARKFRGWKWLTQARFDTAYDNLWIKIRSLEESSNKTNHEVSQLRKELNSHHESVSNKFKELSTQINFEQNEIKDLLGILQRQIKQSNDTSHIHYSEIVERLKKLEKESDTNTSIIIKLLQQILHNKNTIS